ncbi:MAG TPA: hypothetical protein VHO72_08495 [Bacteroidales bacterium]|nr:hypothetical protein [Bacteroidales bacterium]
METPTPIEFLKNRLAELKETPGVDAHLIIEYEKAILVLEFIGGGALDDKAAEQHTEPNTNAKNEEPGKTPKSYFEKFMENQKNKK